MGAELGKAGSGHLRVCDFLGNTGGYRHMGSQRGHPGIL